MYTLHCRKNLAKITETASENLRGSMELLQSIHMRTNEWLKYEDISVKLSLINVALSDLYIEFCCIVLLILGIGTSRFA